MHRRFVLLIIASVMAGACGSSDPGSSPQPAETAGPQEVAAPATVFFERLATHCGKAFEGRIAANEPADPNDPFVGKRLVMHVRECGETEIRVPFHVGEDRSRTWIISRTGNGLQLEHDHRHEDGSADVLTMYGGDTVDGGTERRQEFPVDPFSKDLFTRENRQASLTNVWAMEIEPEQVFVYELARPGRLFRVEFDLTRPVEPPPAPWGYQ